MMTMMVISWDCGNCSAQLGVGEGQSMGLGAGPGAVVVEGPRGDDPLAAPDSRLGGMQWACACVSGPGHKEPLDYNPNP